MLYSEKFVYDMERFREPFGTSIIPALIESITLYIVPSFSTPMILDVSLLRKKAKEYPHSRKIIPCAMGVLPAGIPQGFEAVDFVCRHRKENFVYTSILDIIFTNCNSSYTSCFKMITSIHEFVTSYWHILAPQLNVVGFEINTII